MIEVPELPRRNALVDLGRGFLLPFQSLRLLFATPALRSLTLIIAAITFLSLGAVIAALWHFNPAIVGLVWQRPDTWYLAALHTLFSAAVFLLLTVLGANILPLTLAAPLMDPLSASAERAMGITLVSEGGLKRLASEIARQVGHALVRICVLLLGHLVLLLLFLIPGAGAVVWTWAGWAWTVLWLAAQYLDVPMARHLYSFDEELALLRRRTALCFGFGAAIYLLLWVPLLNFLFVPVAVVAGTTLFRAMVRAKEILPPRDER